MPCWACQRLDAVHWRNNPLPGASVIGHTAVGICDPLNEWLSNNWWQRSNGEIEESREEW